MDVKFPEKDLGVIIEKIKSVMGDRELSKMVNFEQVGNEIVITISKFGTSTIAFESKPTPQGAHLTLGKEKIAFAHRPIKDEVTKKIIKVIEQAGGTVTA